MSLLRWCASPFQQTHFGIAAPHSPVGTYTVLRRLTPLCDLLGGNGGGGGGGGPAAASGGSDSKRRRREVVVVESSWLKSLKKHCMRALRGGVVLLVLDERPDALVVDENTTTRAEAVPLPNDDDANFEDALDTMLTLFESKHEIDYDEEELDDERTVRYANTMANAKNYHFKAPWEFEALVVGRVVGGLATLQRIDTKWWRTSFPDIECTQLHSVLDDDDDNDANANDDDDADNDEVVLVDSGVAVDVAATLQYWKDFVALFLSTNSRRLPSLEQLPLPARHAALKRFDGIGLDRACTHFQVVHGDPRSTQTFERCSVIEHIDTDQHNERCFLCDTKRPLHLRLKALDDVVDDEDVEKLPHFIGSVCYERLKVLLKIFDFDALYVNELTHRGVDSAEKLQRGYLGIKLALERTEIHRRVGCA